MCLLLLLFCKFNHLSVFQGWKVIIKVNMALKIVLLSVSMAS